MSAFGRRLRSLTTIIIMALTGGLARSQDLDRGRSGAQLFETNCIACHHHPNGLARGSFSWTLSSFLEQHYTSSPASAQALTAYLQSIDSHRSEPQRAVHNWQAPENSASASLLRPSGPVTPQPAVRNSPTPKNSTSASPPRPPQPVPVR